MANALASSLMGVGVPPQVAVRLGNNSSSLTAVGTAQGGSSPIIRNNDVVLLTTSGGATAATLDSGIEVGGGAVVFNISSTTALVYPPTGGAIDGGSTNASVSIAQNQGRIFWRVSDTAWRSNASGNAGAAALVGTTLTASGNGTVGGTFGVTGATTLSSTLAVTGTSTLTGLTNFSATAAVAAKAGGGQASATAITTQLAEVTTVASANDSVALPLAVAGTVVHVVNAHATNSMQVFGSGTDTINGVATATGVAQAAGKSATYFCVTTAPAGKWYRVLSA